MPDNYVVRKSFDVFLNEDAVSKRWDAGRDRCDARWEVNRHADQEIPVVACSGPWAQPR